MAAIEPVVHSRHPPTATMIDAQTTRAAAAAAVQAVDKAVRSGKSKPASPTTAQPGQIESTDWLRHGTFSEHKGDKERRAA